MQIALELSKKIDIDLTVSGGTLIPGVYTLAGYESVEFYKGIRAEKLFLSCDAVDAEFGISNRDKREVQMKKTMIQNASQVYMMADHSKIGSSVLMKVADFKEIDYFITDQIDENLKRYIENKGVQVITE